MDLERLALMTGAQELRLQGEAISLGIAIGSAFYHRPNKPMVGGDPTDDIEHEVDRFLWAISHSKADLSHLIESLKKHHVKEAADILKAHLQLLEDPGLTTKVVETIRRTGMNAAHTFYQTVLAYEKRFQSIKDPFFRERFHDLDDVSGRVLGHLLPKEECLLSSVRTEAIVFTEELLPSEVAKVNSCHVAAFVTNRGGNLSHAAIIAKARGIPYVTNVAFNTLFSIQKVIVDGYTGLVIINPTPDTFKHYDLLRKSQEEHVQPACQGALEAHTLDGKNIKISANLETCSDLECIKEYAGVGIGLYRSEYLFLAGNQFPDEDFQYQAYRKLIEALPGKPVVIRTFDIRGDKSPSPQYMETSHLLLCEPHIFRTQLRAIWRAGAHGNISVLFPMISGVYELREAKRLTEEVREDLTRRGVPIAACLPIGCMVEVPSAAVSIDLLAQECDFFSIGTNDLTQYALATDRANSKTHDQYTSYHPGVLRMVRMVATGARDCKVPTSLCGEIAADPHFTALLLGLGIDHLSVAPKYIPMIRNVIRSIDMCEAYALAKAALKLSTAKEIFTLVDADYRSRVPGSLCNQS
jgi:phosphotransferase system enzyme I (PtsI)